MKKLLTILSVAALLAAATMGCSSPILSGEPGPAAVENVKGAEYPEPKVADTPDAFENDDTPALAKFDNYASDVFMDHNFVDDATDWIKFYAYQGQSYIIETIVEGAADTVLSVYPSQADAEAGTNLMATNDDYNRATGYASRVIITADDYGYHYVKCASFANRTGSNRAYKVRIKWVSVLDNAEFNNGTTDGWIAYGDTSKGAQIEYHYDTDINSWEGGEVKIAEYAAGSDAWDIGFYKDGFSISPYSFYEIIFDIRAEGSKSKDVNVVCGMSQSPWTPYKEFESFTVTDQMVTKRFKFNTGNKYDANAQFVINLGGGEAVDFWIDNVIIVKHNFDE